MESLRLKGKEGRKGRWEKLEEEIVGGFDETEEQVWWHKRVWSGREQEVPASVACGSG